ncbi:hypothetical protein BASA81_015418 [Batrachochytrium salamandrivorans]|nr:hypothetical protein BASA81_015418 [Batrachochytrium salamandrivorans]
MAEELVRPVLVGGAVVLGLGKLVQALTKAILLPSSVLGKNKQQLKDFVAGANVPLTRVAIPVTPTASVDACILGQGRGWIVYSNANGVCYEHILPYLYRLARTLNRKVLVYNYRGVGNSTGNCRRTQDMVEDVLACVGYVEQQQLGNEIWLWGHSIGGAVSVLAGDRLGGKYKVVADRSFSKLGEVVLDKLEHGPLGSILFGVLSAVGLLALCVVTELGMQYPVWEPTGGQVTLRLMGAGICAGWFALRLGLPQPMVRNVFAAGVLFQLVFGDGLLARWRYEALPFALLCVFVLGFEACNRNPRLVRALKRAVDLQGWVMDPGSGSGLAPVLSTFCEGDEMIPIHLSLKTSTRAKLKSMQLDGPYLGESNHMYPLSDNELRRVERQLI